MNDNILEKHKSWTILTIVLFFIVLLILFFSSGIGYLDQIQADEEDPHESREHRLIPLAYFFGGLIFCGILTLIILILYYRHIKSIPELQDKKIDLLITIYIIFFGLFIITIILPFFGYGSCCVFPIFFIVMIAININLIVHSKKFEVVIGQIQRKRDFQNKKNIKAEIYPQDFCLSCGCEIENPDKIECPICGHINS
jgi:uncharacterized membrane protein